MHTFKLPLDRFEILNKYETLDKKCNKIFDLSLGTIPQELNELDWKETLSPNNDKLCKHISAFSNHPEVGLLFLELIIKPETSLE